MKNLLALTSQYLANRLPQLSSTPILISGTPRSGTTFVGEILSKSNDLRYVYEPMNPDYGYLIKNNRCQICNCKVDSWYKYLTPENHKDFHNHFKHLINSKAIMGKRALLKAPFSIFATEWLYHEFNTQPLIMFRNPLSFVSSIKRMNWPVDPEDFLKQEDLMSEHLSSYKNLLKKEDNKKIINNGIMQYNIFYSYILKLRKKYPRWLYIKLEDLSQSPIQEFEKIFKHFHLDYNDNIRNKINEITSSKNPTESKVEKVHSLKRNSKELINIWKKRLNKDEIEKILKETKAIGEKIYPEIY